MPADKKAPLLKAIIDYAIDGILTINHRGLIESINPAGCKLFGYTPEEVIGFNISMLMPNPYHDQHDECIARYQRTGKPHIIGIGREVQGLTKDGRIFPFRFSFLPIRSYDFKLGWSFPCTRR